MIDNIYGELANKVSNKIIEDKKLNIKTFDPMTILMIINVIIQIVKCYLQKKMNKKQALEMAQNPGLIEKTLLKRFIKNAMNDNNVPKGINRTILRGEINDKLNELAKDGTEEQIAELEAKLEETEKFLQSKGAI